MSLDDLMREFVETTAFVGEVKDWRKTPATAEDPDDEGEDVDEFAWDESKHPRQAAGSDKGGEMVEFDHAGQKVRVMNDEEFAALDAYFEDSSINERLRRSKGRSVDIFDDYVTTLDKIVERSSLDSDVTVYRGVRDAAGGLLDNIQSGKLVRDFGFQSWTESLGVAQDFKDFGENGFVMKAVLRKGTTALKAGGEQREVILPRGQSIYYKGKDPATGVHVVEISGDE